LEVNVHDASNLVAPVRYFRQGAPRSSWAKGAVTLAALAVASTLPLWANGYMSEAFDTLMFVALASAWNIFGGYTGYTALGNASFWGIGAYAMALISVHLHLGPYAMFAVVPLAGIVAGLFAIPYGWASLRVDASAFVIVTFAVLFVLEHLTLNLSVVGGSAGIGFPIPPWSGNFFNEPFFYAMLITVVLIVTISFLVRRSAFGLTLLAIRDDEDKAIASGIRTGRSKLLAFVLSGFLTGLVGAIYGYFISYTYPQFVFDPATSVLIVLMAFFGGSGTLLGPIVGAIILEPAQIELSTYLGAQNLDVLVLAAVFLVVLLAFPRGIVVSLTASRRRRRESKRQASSPSRPAPDLAPSRPIVALGDSGPA